MTRKYDRLVSELNEEKEKMCIELKKKHKTFLIVLDILMICIVVMNLGAAALTNMMVMKDDADNNIESTFTENNPVQSKVNNYKQSPDAWGFIQQLVFNMIGLFILIWVYLSARMRLYSKKQLIVFATFVFFYVVLVGLDFFNNFGYFIGKVIFQ